MPISPDNSADTGDGCPAGDDRSLGGIRLLAEAPAAVIAALEAQCQWRRYAADAVIFELDDTGTDVFFVVQGRLRIVIFNHQEDDADGPGHGSVTLAEMVPGDTFGELAAIDGAPRSARAVALEDCLLATVPGDAYVAILEDCPKVAIALLRRCAQLIRSLNKRVHTLATQSPTQRIYAELIRLAEPNPQGDGRWIIARLPSHGDIASWAGAEKESVAMAIGQLAREGIVERQHRSLIITKHTHLRLLAHL
jgi:CRP-like cAMP-binding protein